MSERLVRGKCARVALPFFEILNKNGDLLARPLDQTRVSVSQIIEIPRTTQEVNVHNFYVAPAMFHLLCIEHRRLDLPVERK